jgi:hypothetical protein
MGTGTRRLVALVAVLLTVGLVGITSVLAAIQTDKPEYAPGETVYVTGDGMAPGETVAVDIVYPDGSLAQHHEVVADDAGNFSDSYVLPPPDAAVPGTYTVVATGQTSGIVFTTAFDDAININSFAVDCSTASDSFVAGTTVCAKATGLGNNVSGTIEWWAPGAVSATRTTPFGPVNGNATDTFAPLTCGTWTLKVFVPAGTLRDDDTFVVTGCETATPTPTATPTATPIPNQPPTADAGGPYTGEEGAPIALSATSSSDPDGVIVSYEWDLDNDGDFDDATGVTSSVTFPDDGSFTVAVQVTDGDGGEDTDSTTVTVNNVAPTITSVSNDGPIDEGSSATVTVTATDPAGANDPLSYEFDCDNDGSYEVGPQAANSASCSFGDNGSFQVNVRVTDGDGGEDTDSTTVTVNNVAPTITSVSNDGPIDEGSSATVTVTATDPAGANDPLSYEFDCDNDGSYEVGPQAANSASCSFGDNGSFQVNVRVTDGDGGEDTDSATVTVNNVPPTVEAGPGQAGNEGSPLFFVFSCTDPGTADTWTAWVDWGDGSPPQSLSLLSCNSGALVVPHVYLDDNPTGTPLDTYAVTLTVTDDDAGSGSDSTTATVSNVPPTVTASFAATTVSCGTGNATLEVSFTDPGIRDTHTATIDWGDGSPVQSLGLVLSSFSQSHTYGAAGPYNASVTVIDDDLGGGSDSVNAVTVNFTLVGGGILQPINPGPPTSIFKYKSTIPVKIKVANCDGSYPGMLAPQISVQKTSSNTPGGVDEPIYSTSAADTGTTMRFTGSPDFQYIYNLATRSLSDPSATYQVRITIPLTGQVVTATFGLKP